MIIIASPNEHIPEQIAAMASAVFVFQPDGTLRDYAAPLPSHRRHDPLPKGQDKSIVQTIAEDLGNTSVYKNFASFWARKPAPGQVPTSSVRPAPPVQQHAMETTAFVPPKPPSTGGVVTTQPSAPSSLKDVEAAILQMSNHTLGGKNVGTTKTNP